MKRNDLTSLMLVGMLALSTAAGVLLSAAYVRALGKAQALQWNTQKLQEVLGQAQRNRAIVQAMAAEAVEYSRQNPAIEPVLKQFNSGALSTPAQPSTR
jgi:Na+-transporting NADH:ubiquinone oxidoreductase subunit NqrC